MYPARDWCRGEGNQVVKAIQRIQQESDQDGIRCTQHARPTGGAETKAVQMKHGGLSLALSGLIGARVKDNKRDESRASEAWWPLAAEW